MARNCFWALTLYDDAHEVLSSFVEDNEGVASLPVDGRKRNVASRGERGGFTLIEVLVALAVMGVATGLMVKTIFYTMNLSKENASHRVAASLASERLVSILNSPGDYVWPSGEALAGGALAEIGLPGEDVEHGLRPVEAPVTMPTDHRSILREESFFDRFSWRSFVRIPESDAAYVEVTVTVDWENSGRDRTFALTGAMPRSRLRAVR